MCIRDRNKIKEEQMAILTTFGEASFEHKNSNNEHQNNIKKEVENHGTNTEKNHFACKMCSVFLESGYMLDCGHLPFCNDCSMSIKNEDNAKCPICKKTVAYRLRALIEESL